MKLAQRLLLIILIGIITLFTQGTVHAAPSAPGDIAFVGFNADAKDDLAFATLVPITTGDSILFTDENWDGSAFSDGEGVITWTATEDLPAGTVIALNDLSASSSGNPAPSATTGNVVKSGGFNLSGENEAVYALIGTIASPTAFLAAITNDDFAAASGSLSNTGLSLTGASPTALEFDDVNSDADVGRYIGDRTSQSNFSDYLALINDISNWELADASGDQSGDLPFDLTTSVQLESFSGSIDKNGNVKLSWETTEEIDHAGFNIYRRAVGSRTTWSQINETLIASRGSAFGGGNYQFTDELAPTGHWEYVLEDVETDNDTFKHLDFVVTIEVRAVTAVTYLNSTTSSQTFPYTSSILSVLLLSLLTVAAIYDRKVSHNLF